MLCLLNSVSNSIKHRGTFHGFLWNRLYHVRGAGSESHRYTNWREDQVYQEEQLS